MIAYLLKNFEARPVMRTRETEEEAARRLYGAVHVCHMTLAPRFSRLCDVRIIL